MGENDKQKPDSETIIIIEWSYTPKDFFEEPVALDRGNYSIEMDDGQIAAKMPADTFDSDKDLKDRIETEIQNFFLGAQGIRRQPFNISGGSYSRNHPDGRKDVTLVVGASKLKIKGGNVDLIYTDSNGKVHDTKKERIAQTSRLGELAAKYAASDATAIAILDSFNASVIDPKDELVHLYEIWECLSKHFGNESETRSKLGIPRKRRSRLGQLANDAPLKQGRHRGKHSDSLRDATQDELNEARQIALQMMTGYLEYLESQA